MGKNVRILRNKKSIFLFLFFLYIVQASSLFSKEIMIVHSMGKTKINGTPKKIITLFNGATDAAIALNIKPIAIVDSWLEKPIYKYLRSSLLGVEQLGLETQPNIEKIALLKPDLIIATKVRHEKIYKILNKIAPTIVIDKIVDFKKTVEIMGKALNKEKEAKKILTNWNSRVKRINKKLFNRCGTKSTQSISAINVRADYLRVYLEKSYLGTILRDIGYVIKNNDKYPNNVYIKLTSKESLPLVDADVFILLKQSEQKIILNNYKKLKKHPLWKALKAVKTNKVYEVNPITWSFSTGILGANLVLDDIERLLVNNNKKCNNE